MWVIIGNFSGSAFGLKGSLENQGYDVLIITDGDGFKGYKSNDFHILPRTFWKRIFAEYKSIYYCFLSDKIIVQDYMPFIRFNIFAYIFFWLAIILKKGVYYVVGDDPVFYAKGPYLAPEIELWERIKLSDQRYRRLRILDRLLFRVFHLVVDRIVTGAFLYDLIYKDHYKYVGLCKFIVNKNTPPIRDFNDIVLFHGIQSLRADVKGSDLVQKLDEKVLVSIDLPFDEYVSFKNTSNIVIDQVVGFEPGMNAIESVLSSGQIVLCGYNSRWCENNTLQELDIHNNESLMRSIERIKSGQRKVIFEEMYKYYSEIYGQDRSSLTVELSLFK